MSVSTPRKNETTTPALLLRGVGRNFGSLPAVQPMDLEVTGGEFLAIIGPSGCGKSTLLRMIAGLDSPTTGTIERHYHQDPDDKTVANKPTATADIAYVFQDAHLLPWRNVVDNVALPLELAGVSRRERRDAAREAIVSVGLSEAVDRYPNQLSGGMRMRVSLARALVTNPSLLLLDEPFAALDEITRQRLDEQLHQLWRTRGMTVIFVTHSIMEAAFLAQRALVFSRRPARIVLDRTLQLPPTRNMALRTDATFAAEMRMLFDALESSEGASQ